MQIKQEKVVGRSFPVILQGILPIDKSRISSDIIAGITLAALGIPTVMGYTEIIGTPVVTGLYAMLLPTAVFAFFGSSRHLTVSADSATAAMVASALVSQSFVPETPRYVALASLVALLAGGMLLLARVLRLGFLADFLSRTVLVGFLTGVGIQVACGALNGIFGVAKGGDGFFGRLWFTFQHLHQTNLTNFGIALAVVGIIVGFEKFARRFPGALLAVIGMTAASAFFHWGEHGVRVVGNIPGGMPRLGAPDVTWNDIVPLLPVAFSCFVVILAQSAATARAYAIRYHDKFNQNIDLVGLSLANIAAGFSGTFVVNGSPTQTSMVDTAGGRSQISQLTTAAMIIVVLLFLTGPLSHLPDAVLAAIVFLIGVKLIDYRGLAEIYRVKPREFAVALATAATVVCVGVKQGIILAVILSLLQHIRRSYRPHTAVILHDEKDHWRMEDAVPGQMLEPGMVMFWFGADLFYANVGFFVEQVHKLVDESPSPVRWMVIDFSAITGVDFTAGRALAELYNDLAKQGVVLVLARVAPNQYASLEKMGLAKLIGANRFYDSRLACLDVYRSEVLKGSTAPAGGKTTT